MVMIYSLAKVQGRRVVGSEDRVETNGQTDGGDCITSNTNAVGKYLHEARIHSSECCATPWNKTPAMYLSANNLLLDRRWQFSLRDKSTNTSLRQSVSVYCCCCCSSDLFVSASSFFLCRSGFIAGNRSTSCSRHKHAPLN